MSTFTVHEPPRRKNEEAASPDRFAFVRDGFYFWAFVLGPVWMLYHRLWLVLLMYLVGTTGLQIALWTLGVSGAVKFAVGLLIALLVGFEAGTLRRWSLRRWTDRGTVVAHNREAAEHRFFDRWFDGTSASYEPPAPLRPAHVPTSDHDVMGLFPEPQSRS
ncbi:MAG: DUF2628 domain-containing protein [Alphaproteobacteria bacterium]|nr:DUF2628 domain-containing protein [Alphaproteobacteria bacterium]